MTGWFYLAQLITLRFSVLPTLAGKCHSERSEPKVPAALFASVSPLGCFALLSMTVFLPGKTGRARFLFRREDTRSYYDSEAHETASYACNPGWFWFDAYWHYHGYHMDTHLYAEVKIVYYTDSVFETESV